MKSVSKAHRAMKIWRALWNIAAAMHYCSADEDPSLGIRRETPKGRSATWEEGEVVRLVKAAWRRKYHGLACIIAIACDAQFAPVDSRSLRPQDSRNDGLSSGSRSMGQDRERRAGNAVPPHPGPHSGLRGDPSEQPSADRADLHRRARAPPIPRTALRRTSGISASSCFRGTRGSCRKCAGPAPSRLSRAALISASSRRRWPTRWHSPRTSRRPIYRSIRPPSSWRTGP